MLEQLVGVDDVECLVVELERVRVCGPELDAGDRARAEQAPSFGYHTLLAVDADGPTRGDTGGEVERDRAGPAPDVEEPHPRREKRQQIAGRVFGRPPAVAAEHRLVVAMGVRVAHWPVRYPAFGR